MGNTGEQWGMESFPTGAGESLKYKTVQMTNVTSPAMFRGGAGGVFSND